MKSFVSTLPIVSVVLAALAIVSCSDKNLDNSAKDNEIRIDAVHPSQTRTSNMGFENGDQIGVFVVPEGAILQPFGNAVNNGKFVYNGYVWNPASTYYWNEGKHNVYAYYPYTSNITDTESHVFNVSEDQSSDENYFASDFLWAKADGIQASTSPVSLKFSHVMSSALVEIVKSKDFEGDLPDDIQVYLHNTVTTANIDLATGGACKDAYASPNSIKMQKLSTNLFSAIVVPQNITTRRPLVEIIMGNVSYLMEGTMSFKQGYQHTITVTVTENPQQAEINIGGGIGNWN